MLRNIGKYLEMLSNVLKTIKFANSKKVLKDNLCWTNSHPQKGVNYLFQKTLQGEGECIRGSQYIFPWNPVLKAIGSAIWLAYPILPGLGQFGWAA